ncbi:hypothetical protein CYMTET_30278 [Cymbomonas tetramitiformis]|uniref:non-specific serine/threonine protein kinase n=1 Tax=Cymbomonas tetramitiformis TaxID=36881 RepID=A0AAE0FJA3_9CHLO|nr:hypothetical protein CYMTET_30278 [Cymbomonas tetramitiformis]
MVAYPLSDQYRSVVCAERSVVSFSSWDLRPGDVLKDKYLIVKRLGEGSNGVTYEAEIIGDDVQNKTLVAVKVVSLRGAGNWKAIDLFERETGVLASLKHPSIPKCLDSFKVDTSADRLFCLVQQKTRGQTLQAS